MSRTHELAKFLLEREDAEISCSVDVSSPNDEDPDRRVFGYGLDEHAITGGLLTLVFAEGEDNVGGMITGELAPWRVFADKARKAVDAGTRPNISRAAVQRLQHAQKQYSLTGEVEWLLALLVEVENLAYACQRELAGKAEGSG